MYLPFDAGELVPFFALSIPIVAIVGGVTAGIVRMIQRQRAFELMQRERIAMIERGIDPGQLQQLSRPVIYDDHGLYTDPRVAYEHRRQGLLIGGIVTLFVGIALCIFLRGVSGDDQAWLVGILPGSVGVALLLSAFLIRPIDPGAGGPPHPPTH